MYSLNGTQDLTIVVAHTNLYETYAKIGWVIINLQEVHKAVILFVSLSVPLFKDG